MFIEKIKNTRESASSFILITAMFSSCAAKHYIEEKNKINNTDTDSAKLWAYFTTILGYTAGGALLGAICSKDTSIGMTDLAVVGLGTSLVGCLADDIVIKGLPKAPSLFFSLIKGTANTVKEAVNSIYKKFS